MLWIRIKYRLSLFYKSLLFKMGFRKLLLKNRYGERIIVWHGIDTVGETKYNSRFFSKDKFETFIKYITQNYNVISLDDYYNKKFKKDTLNIALTFDDGYLNNYTYAIPILKKYNVPANFYITTIHEQAPFLWADFLDIISYHTLKKEIVVDKTTYYKNAKHEFVSKGTSLKNKAKKMSYKSIKDIYKAFANDWQTLPPDDFGDYWKLMNKAQIKEIANHPLFTVGAHGTTHASLVDISLKEAKQEILNSKNTLEIICEKPIEEFAFPFGYYNEQLTKYCKDIGFKRLLLVDYNNDDDKKNEICKNRFVMNPYISLDQQLACLLKGTYF